MSIHVTTSTVETHACVQFCTAPLFWVIFEAVATLYFVTLVFYGLGSMSFNAMWLTMLSNWSLILTAACTVIHFSAITVHYAVQRRIRPSWFLCL
jgi:hypothetical protein